MVFKQLFLFLFLLFGSACTLDRTIPLWSPEEEEALRLFQELPPEHQAVLVDEEEEGQELLLCLNFIDQLDKAPLAAREVYFYHATNQGLYEPSDPNDESTARLHQQAITDELGRIFVKTILPGDYGSRSDNRHIHTTVSGAQPEAYDLHFRQFANLGLQRFIHRSAQHFLVDLINTSDSSLLGFMTVQAKFNNQ